MSDLHNLSAPIEGKDVKTSPKKPNKPDFSKVKNTLKDLHIRFTKKVLISLGISVSLVSLVVVLLHISQPKVVQAPTDPADIEQAEETTASNQDTEVKFTRFDGNQYFFYYPDNYSFLNRSKGEILNLVTFSNQEDSESFYVQEFLYLDPSQNNLEAIYSELVPTEEVATSKMEITNNGNTFEKSSYGCNSEQTQITNNECDGSQYIYATEVNGLLVVFVNSSINEKKFEDTILSTFAKNIVNSSSLSEAYVFSSIPRIKTRLDTLLLLGAPKSKNPSEPCENCKKELVYQLRDSMEIIFAFDEMDTLANTYGKYAQFEFNLADALNNSQAQTSPQEAYDTISNNSTIRRNILDPNPDAITYLEEDPIDSTYWHITIYSGNDMAVILGEYWISKETGRFKSAEQ